jgi:hypothetical protein
MIDDFLVNLLASLAYDLLKSLPSRFQGSRDDLLRDLRAELARQTQALEALNAVLARLGVERVVRIEGSASNSIIITGDGNTVTVADGGALAQRWQELQVSDAEAADLYRERIAQRYAHLVFPLSGISFHALLEQVYQPLQAAPVKDLTRWYQAERAPLHERCEMDEILTEDRPVALLGLLGGGKTTTLHYLTWAYARRIEDRLLWRGDELIPFYVTARDLAEAWQDETDFLPACARAVTRARHHPLGSPYLAYRVLESALKQGNALLLIDALDEHRVPDSTRRDFLLALHSTWQEEPFRDNVLLLTSRPHAFLEAGFRPYALQTLDDPRLERLAYRLGKVLLQERDEAEQAAKLEALTRLVVSPQMAMFASPSTSPCSPWPSAVRPILPTAWHRHSASDDWLTCTASSCARRSAGSRPNPMRPRWMKAQPWGRWPNWAGRPLLNRPGRSGLRKPCFPIRSAVQRSRSGSALACFSRMSSQENGPSLTAASSSSARR